MIDKREILITGCSSGIGRLTAITVARAGHRVYASMRSCEGKNKNAANNLSDLARSEALDLEVMELDAADPNSIPSAIEKLRLEGKRIDVLINNAGTMSIGLAEGFADDQVEEQFALNFFGPVRLCRAVLPQMRERRSGLIINVSSILGRVLFPACGVYCASKFALEAYTEILHYELTGLGVESVLVEPGPYPTNLVANSPRPLDLARVQEYEGLSSLRETFVGQFETFFASEAAPKPQEIADAILRLIELPSGKRPLRTVCGPGYGTAAINQNNAEVQKQVLSELGMDFFAARVD